ncbi:MAG: SDR family NAD(P)-dependent oxidoreductase [Streptomyces sp.]|nr:SDR family NAD(P)-dependent oxidoreductase [Streptomyces sp.]
MTSAVVIGAGPGIGLAVARRFAREGFDLALIARSEETVATAVERLDGVRALPLIADSGDETALRAALDTAAAELGAPDVVVYNAAVIRPDAVGELPLRTRLDTYAVNVLGALTAAAHTAPGMAERGRGTFVATVTVSGPVAPGTAWDPDEIADHYWRLHIQPRTEWEREVLI